MEAGIDFRVFFLGGQLALTHENNVPSQRQLTYGVNLTALNQPLCANP